MTDDQRQLPVLTGLEGELDLAWVHLLHLGDVAIIGAEEGRSFVRQDVEREDHVLGGDRAAVVEPGLRAQGEGNPGAIFGDLDGLGDQAVHRERLVGRADHQRVVNEANLRGRDAPDDEGVEAVEGADGRLLDRAALGRVRVDVVEMGEVGPVFRRAVHGQRMADVDIPARRVRGRSGDRERKQESRNPGGEGCHDRSQTSRLPKSTESRDCRHPHQASLKLRGTGERLVGRAPEAATLGSDVARPGPCG